MFNKGGTLFVVYSIPDHSGYELINRIFTSLEEARKYVDPINEAYSKDFSFWDGSQVAFDIKTKIIKNGKIEEWEDCDRCGYDCKCLGDSPRKTKEAYETYWTPERHKHVHEHFYKNKIDENCEFCKDPNDKYKVRLTVD